MAGLGLWLVAAVVAEVVVWPGERRIQVVVSTGWETGTDGRFALDCRLVTGAAALLCIVFLAAFIVMIAQP